jgi:hypothetical protein
MSDLIAIIKSFGFVFDALGCAEWLRRAGGLRADFNRKFLQINVGML